MGSLLDVQQRTFAKFFNFDIKSPQCEKFTSFLCIDAAAVGYFLPE